MYSNAHVVRLQHSLLVADYDTLIFFQAWPDWLLAGPIRLGLYCTVISRPALAHGRPRGARLGRPQRRAIHNHVILGR